MIEAQTTNPLSTPIAIAPRKKDNWRLIAWNGKERAGYVILREDGGVAFTQNWRDATVLPTKEAWDDARAKVNALGEAWTSTPLNAPRKIKEASA